MLPRALSLLPLIAALTATSTSAQTRSPAGKAPPKGLVWEGRPGEPSRACGAARLAAPTPLVGQRLAQVGPLAADELQVVLHVLDVAGHHGAQRHLAFAVVRALALERLVGQ